VIGEVVGERLRFNGRFIGTCTDTAMHGG
jgi:hypothetical protein